LKTSKSMMFRLYLSESNHFHNFCRTQTFLDAVGRTNTEYYTNYPVYGSNLNALQGRKSNTYATVPNDVVKVLHEDKDYMFQTFETPNRHYIPKRWRFENSHYSDNNDTLPNTDEPIQGFNSVAGKLSKFRKYVSSCEKTSIRLDFCFETNNMKKKW
jgi:hypothetical protein